MVDLPAERQHEGEHDAEHAGREQMNLVAFEGHAHDQRHEHRQHEAIERWLVDGGEGLRPPRITPNWQTMNSAW